MATHAPWLPADSEEDPCCCEGGCNCDETFASWSSITLSGVTFLVDGPSGDTIPDVTGETSANATFLQGDSFGSWSSSDGGEPTFGTFGAYAECIDDGDGGLVLVLAVGCNSGDGSGVVNNGYFAGQAYAFQVNICNLELDTDYPALSPFGGSVRFNS